MNMKKSTAGVFAMVVMVAALTLIPAQEASAQSPVKSRTALNEWLMSAEYLYYIVANSPSLDNMLYQVAITYAQAGELSLIDGAYYLTDEGTLAICMDTENGRKGVFLLVFKTKEMALKNMNEEEGIDVVGPFELGASSAARNASVQRILASVQSFIKTGIFPKKW